MDKTVLSFKDVSFAYDGAHAACINKVNMSCKSGRVTGIVGPNGCGKSTVLKLAVGLMRPSEGSVYIGDTDIADFSAKQRAHAISYMAQAPVVSHMTVQQLVMCGRYAHLGLLQQTTQLDRDIALKAMQDAGIVELQNILISQLSGGQKQRAYLAMLLAQQARVMLLDEPFSALDIHAAYTMMALCRQIAHENDVAVVMIVHDLNMALRYCDDIVIMDNGKIRNQGQASDSSKLKVLEDVFNIYIDIHMHRFGVSYSFTPR